MAVRPARNTGLIFTLIFFVFLAVVGIALSIVFYSQLSDQKQSAKSVEEKLNAFVDRGQRDSGDITALQREAREQGRSITAHLQARIGRLKLDLIGSDQLAVEQIEQQLADAGVTEGRNALEVIREQAGVNQQRTTEIEQLRASLAAAKSEVAGLSDAIAEARTAAEQRVEQLGAQLLSLENDNREYRQATSAQITGFQQQLEKARGSGTERMQQVEQDLNKARQQVSTLERALSSVKGELKRDTPEVPDSSSQIDSRIIAVHSDDQLVYIDLGRRDHLVLGMTFEIYDARRGVGLVTSEDGDTVLRRGKATIEVVKMSEKSSACRIVRSSFGRPVLVGDVAANLVYDKDRSFKFYVFGDFDLDGDGQATLSDRERIVNLIERWGGTVVRPEERRRRLDALLGAEAAEQNVLPLDTDFLLVGREPKLPQAGSDETDPRIIARARQARRLYEDYQTLLSEAGTLSIPVLNQNRFLALIGYYEQ